MSANILFFVLDIAGQGETIEKDKGERQGKTIKASKETNKTE